MVGYAFLLRGWVEWVLGEVWEVSECVGGQGLVDVCKEALSYYRRDNPFSGTIGGLSLVPLITF